MDRELQNSTKHENFNQFSKHNKLRVFLTGFFMSYFIYSDLFIRNHPEWLWFRLPTIIVLCVFAIVSIFFPTKFFLQVIHQVLWGNIILMVLMILSQNANTDLMGISIGAWIMVIFGSFVDLRATAAVTASINLIPLIVISVYLVYTDKIDIIKEFVNPIVAIAGAVFSSWRINKLNTEKIIADYYLKQEKQRIEVYMEELIVKNEEIEQQKEEIYQTLQTTEAQRSEIQKKNEDITASINYALRIQNAIIPKATELQKYFDCFVFFRPKDIVSGDFYWFADKGDKKILAVADCTGHGVSGAFMTMIGNNILNQIIHDHEIHEPHEILNRMPILLEKTLLHSGGIVKDGMDISIVSIEQGVRADTNNGKGNNPFPPLFVSPQTTRIVYAGAMNPLYYVQNQEFKEIKADKIPIDGKAKDDFSYQKHELIFDENNPTLKNQNLTLYLCSDGFQDQFGGEHDKKFMVKNLKKLLFEISEKQMVEQKKILEQTFENWKKYQKQTDDVLVIGLRI